MIQYNVHIQDLKLGDLVIPDTFALGSAYNTHLVWKIDEKEIHLERVYMGYPDVLVMGNRIIPHIGVERYSIPKTSLILWTLLYRNEKLNGGTDAFQSGNVSAPKK